MNKKTVRDVNLKGKRVLISGSSRGIGLSIARGFLEEKACVAITSRNAKDVERVRTDLSDRFPLSVILGLMRRSVSLPRRSVCYGKGSTSLL